MACQANWNTYTQLQKKLPKKTFTYCIELKVQDLLVQTWLLRIGQISYFSTPTNVQWCNTYISWLWLNAHTLTYMYNYYSGRKNEKHTIVIKKSYKMHLGMNCEDSLPWPWNAFLGYPIRTLEIVFSSRHWESCWWRELLYPWKVQ